MTGFIGLAFNEEEFSQALNEEEKREYKEILKNNGEKVGTEATEKTYNFLINTLDKYGIKHWNVER